MEVLIKNNWIGGTCYTAVQDEETAVVCVFSRDTHKALREVARDNDETLSAMANRLIDELAKAEGK